MALFNIKPKLRKRVTSPKLAKSPRQRIKYTEQGKLLIAEVEQRKGLRWHPTTVREVVDLNLAAKALSVHDARYGVDDDDTSGFGDRVKSFAKKVAKSKVGKVVIKAHVAPLKIAHKITHAKNSPIRKAEMALQKYVGKALPFTKPFIAVHTKLAGGVHAGMEAAFKGKSVTKAVKAAGKKLKPTAADAAALAAAASAAGGAKLAAGAAGAVKAALPSKAELSALAEARRKTLAAGIAKAVAKAPPAAKAAVKSKLVTNAKSWVVVSPTTGIKYTFQL
jgi:hypothetical protein